MLVLAALLATLIGCGTPTPDPDVVVDDLDASPPPAAVARLTDAQWRASAEAVLGVRFTGPLPDDYRLHGHASIGAAALATGPADLELYDGAAWAVADTALSDANERAVRLGCDEAAPGCLRAFAAQIAGRAWRRVPETDELDALDTLAATVAAAGEPGLPTRAVAAAVLAAPDFLYRIETGAPTADGSWRYSDQELAARLSLLLVDRGPDDALVAAVDAGALQTAAGVRTQAERLLATPEARAVITRFWDEVFDLQLLDDATKDPVRFPYFDDALRQSMVREVESLLVDVSWDRDVDFREVLTTRRAVIDAPLAGIYGVQGVGAEPTEVELPEARGGLLGRAAIAAIYSHPSINSPTKRGKFIRTKLLCQSVQPPPPGLIASLDDVAAGETLRDRMEQHAVDPACSPCHVVIDPPGFGMENVDPVGRWRNLDGARPVDASGELDGAAFNGVAELGAAVANHPDLPGCLATDLWRFATGWPETADELDDIAHLGAGLAEDGWRWKRMLLQLVTSDAFLGPAPGEVAAPGESCNGLDDDGDGQIDEVERACAAPGQTSRCVSGAWAACGGPP